MQKILYKTDPFNFIPFTKTPWAGKKISSVKKKYFPESADKIPQHIGESIEFSSKIHPLFLKWIEAQDFLSIQVHPKNDHPLLKSNECGKPESWLVLDVNKETENSGFVYLGFKENFSKDEIISHILNGDVERCLYRYFPKKMDYISIPTGCVHALGSGVFIAEPQSIVPGKIGVTWRIFDWGRERETHIQESLSAIDWNLPRGKGIDDLLVQPMQHQQAFLGNARNPFALQVFSQQGTYQYVPLQKKHFSIITVASGEVTLSSKTAPLTLHGGETAFIDAEVESVSVTLANKHGETPCAAFFASSDCN